MSTEIADTPLTTLQKAHLKSLEDRIQKAPEDRIRLALCAAERYCASVRGPFLVEREVQP